MIETVILDIETDLSHSQIWCVGLEFEDGSTELVFDPCNMPNEDEFKYIAHYGTSFDFPKLGEHWDYHVPIANQTDTVLLSKMYDTNVTGGHSLAAWCERLKLGDEGKMAFDKELFDWGYTPEMGKYCLRDCTSLRLIYNWLVKNMAKMGFSEDSIRLEHDARVITDWQQKNGFKLDVERASDLYAGLASEKGEIERKLHEVFPPLIHKRYSDKRKDADGNWIRLKDNVEEFNVGSRPQIARRLESLGVRWTKKTPKTDAGGGGNIIVDEGTLKPLAVKYPEAALCLSYLTLGKRASMVNGWLKAVKENSRVYGSVDTLGAITSRCTHSGPNLAQVEKGPVMRGNWIVERGNKLVGVDASGLELRMLAHYMQDEDYINLILHGDIHWANALSLEIASGNRLDINGDEVEENERLRNQAKTFIYAFLYGAGDAKIGTIVGGGAAAGKRLKEAFLENTPALKTLREKIDRIAKQGHLPALDGRRLRVRHQHAALNTLLQGAGAIIMKRALVIGYYELQRTMTPWQLVAQVHDELQSEVPSLYAKHVGKTFVKGIIKAGEYYNMRCPLDGEAKIGNSWAETH